MAKKKNKINVRAKLKAKKPLVKCDKAVDDILRIKRNEQAKLYRLRNKFDALPRGKKKKEADTLRKQIKAQERAVGSLSANVKQVREYCNEIKDVQAYRKRLKLQNAAKNRKLDKLYGKGKFTDEYKTINKDIIKTLGEIAENDTIEKDLLYKINRALGFEPDQIVKRVKITPKEVERRFKKEYPSDFTDEMMDDIVEAVGGGPKEEILDEEILEDEEAEIEDEEPTGDKDFVEDYSDVFWQMWKDFDQNEKRNIEQGVYNEVIFKFGGSTHKYKGGSLTLITMTANDMWRFSRENGSDTYIVKYVSNDGTRIKWEVDEF